MKHFQSLFLGSLVVVLMAFLTSPDVGKKFNPGSDYFTISKADKPPYQVNQHFLSLSFVGNLPDQITVPGPIETELYAKPENEAGREKENRRLKPLLHSGSPRIVKA